LPGVSLTHANTSGTAAKDMARNHRRREDNAKLMRKG
jgi:hypothetical protein